MAPPEIVPARPTAAKDVDQKPADAPKTPEAAKADVADATGKLLETERRINTTNSVLGILKNFCTDGKLDAAKESVGKMEAGLKAGDIVYMQGLWIAVSETSDKKKQFSLLGDSQSAAFDHLFDLLQKNTFFPMDESARAEKLKELEAAGKDPFAAVQGNFLKLLETAFSGKKVGDDKLPAFFKEISDSFPKAADISNYDTAEKFSDAVGKKLGKPFETLFGNTQFSQKVSADLKSSLEAAYTSAANASAAKPKEIGDVIASALGSVNMSDFFMKFLEQLMDVLNSGSLMMGASNHFMDEKLKESRMVDPALAALNTSIVPDMNDASLYKPGEQIAFACQALGLPKDYGNFQGNDALEKFYRHLTEDRKLVPDVREMTQKEGGKDFLERLQPGDLIFSVNTDLRGRGTYMERVVQVKKIVGKEITVRYLPESAEEGKTDVMPKEVLLSDINMRSLYASVRPLVKVGEAGAVAAAASVVAAPPDKTATPESPQKAVPTENPSVS